MRSFDIDAGITIIHFIFFTEHISANPIPVLPLVGSIMVVSLLIKPSSIAFSIITLATLSLIEPAKLTFSSFA